MDDIYIKKIILLTLIELNFAFNYDQSPKIEIVGKPITIKDFMDDWNYFVRVQCTKTCGGVLLTPKWVVTTAECISKSEKCSVKMGSIYIDEINGDESIEILSSNTFIHPDFKEDCENSYKLDNIGMIQLSKKLRLTRKLNVVTIPEEIPGYSDGCVAISWSGDTSPISLYQVNLKNTNFKSCKSRSENLSSDDKFLCDRFGITISLNDTGLNSNLHLGAALMCHHFFFGILSSSGYNIADSYFNIWTFFLGHINWINGILKENDEKPITFLKDKIFDDKTIEVPKIFFPTSTETKIITENYNVENSFFENEHLDPYKLYWNQTKGKQNKKELQYEVKFRIHLYCTG